MTTSSSHSRVTPSAVVELALARGESVGELVKQLSRIRSDLIALSGGSSGDTQANGTIIEVSEESLSTLQSDNFDTSLEATKILAEAVALRKAGALNEAALMFLRAISVDPSNPDHYSDAASTLKQAKKIHELNQLIERAEHFLGGSDSGKATLARLYHYVSRKSHADELLINLRARAARRDVVESSALAALANVAMVEGHVSSAAYYVRCAAELDGRERRVRSVERLIEPIAKALDFSVGELARLFVSSEHRETVFAPDFAYDRIAVIARDQVPLAAPREGGLLLVVNSLAIGGSEKNAITMANEFAKSKEFAWVKILVGGGVENPMFIDLVSAEVEIVMLTDFDPEISGLACLPQLRGILQALTPTNSRSEIGRTIRALQLLQPQLVHVYAGDVRAIQTAAAGACSGFPVIMNPGGFTPGGRMRGEGYQTNDRWMRSAYRALLELNGVRMLNCSLAALVEYQRWLDVDQCKLGINYYGIQLEEFAWSDARVDELRRLYNIGIDDFVVGGVFRFESVKRPSLWIETAAIVAETVPDVRFLLVGSGELMAATQARATELGLGDRVIFAGRQVDMPNWYRLMSTYLQTSLSEGLGNVLLEAQSSGVPVVAPLVGGMPETLIHGRTGWLVYHATPETLAERVSWIAQNRGWRDDASTFCRHFIRDRYSRERMIGDSMKAYLSLSG